MTLSPGQWALMGLAALLIGVSRSGITGLGILAVAIAASVLPPRDSTGTVLLVLLVGDVMAIAMYRRVANWPHLRRIFPWAGAGVLLGAFALGHVNNDGAQRLIGMILLVLIGAYFVRQRAVNGRGDEAPAFMRYPWLVAGTGVLAGFTTMVANAAGPIMILYLLALRLPKEIFVGTTAWFFLALNLFKTPFSIGLGLINAASPGVVLPLAPLVVAGAFLGRYLLRVLDQRRFEQIALLLSFVAGVRLLL